jgi:membrane associated rhomboid family serine protease/TolA-binding protein
MYFFYYVPVGIDATLRRFPVMTAAYTGICLFVFTLARFFPGAARLDFYNLVYVPADANPLIAVGAGFLHFGYLHLLGNLVYLLLLGRYVEDRVGPVMFAILYLSSAGVGNYLQGVFNTYVLHDPAIGIIGASGAISGLLGVFSVRFIRSRLRIAYWAFMPLQAYTRAGTVEIPAIFAIALWFLLQIVRGLVQVEGGAAQVAHVTHITGFLWGVMLALAFGQYGRGRAESLLKEGESYARRGESYAAQGSLIRYLTYRSDDAHGYAALARAMVATGNGLGAEKTYRQACELLLSQQQRGESERLFHEVLRGFPSFVLGAEPHLNLAFGLERNLKPQLAVRAYENFEESYPTHPEAAFALLRAAGLHGGVLTHPAKAHECYTRLIDRYPDDRWVDFAREQLRQLGRAVAR